nr:AMP-binding protein [Bacteroidota bacterium]
MSELKNFEDYQKIYQSSIDKPEIFWSEQASKFTWTKPWDKIVEWDFHTGNTKWFLGGKMNITVNCLDRHLKSRANKIALIWEPNNPEATIRSFTYLELLDRVCQCANALRQIGIQKGDRVCLYMPMIPELTIALLACARIGAVHS